MVIFNRLFAFVLGAAILAGGLLVMLEAIWAWTGSGFVWIPGHEWLKAFKTTEWSDNLVIAISIGVAIVGLLLLVVGLRPERRRLARFDTDHDTWLLWRRSTEAYLGRRLATAMATSLDQDPPQPETLLAVEGDGPGGGLDTPDARSCGQDRAGTPPRSQSSGPGQDDRQGRLVVIDRRTADL